MQRINKIASTVFGIGYLPFAPGTFAAAFAVVIWYFLATNFNQFPLLQIGLIIIFSLTGVYCSGKLCAESGKDPSFVVIDELVGMWIAVLLIPPTILNYTIAFMFFRFFDIAKPLGIRRMEKMKNGWGIMSDDILAGIYSNIALRLLIEFIPLSFDSYRM